MLKKYKLFLESINNYYINLASGELDYNISGSLNRLKHLVYKLEDSGSPMDGEKISEILLGGVNLNILDLSYPFVDLKVMEPIEGVTIKNELISVKTSRDKHSLKDAVTYVNGFKIGQLIQFAISNINLNLYKSKVFKKRNAIKLSSVTSYYDSLIKVLFDSDDEIYTFAFTHTLLFYALLKEYLDILANKNIIITNRAELYGNIAVLLCFFIDEKFNTNYLQNLKLKISEKTKSDAKQRINDFFIDRIKQVVNFKGKDYGWLEFIPEHVRNLQISYCILYFDKENEKSSEIVLNLHKTHSISFEELFINTIKIWTSSSNDVKSRHMKAKEKKQNLYLDYKGVIEAFQSNNIKGDDVFNTHIKVIFSSDWESTYSDRTEELKNLYVKVINNVKSIDNDDKQVQILNALNNFLNKISNVESSEKDYYINKFSDMFGK